MKKVFLNKSNLQLIAAAAMFLDHAAVFARDYASFYLCHILGRITIIIMCYFVAEGYYKTHNVYNYIGRLGLFALIAQLPFYLYVSGQLPADFLQFCYGNYRNLNVIFTLFVALCLLTIMKSQCKPFVKAAAFAAAVLVTRHSDWRWMALLWVLIFGLFRGRRCMMPLAAGVILVNFAMKIAGFAIGASGNTVHTLIWGFVQLGGLLAIPLLMRYNGEKGNAPKLGFYIFYPAHLLVLVLLRIIF